MKVLDAACRPTSKRLFKESVAVGPLYWIEVEPKLQ